MNQKKKEVLNQLLVVLFNNILTIEEKALKKGPFSNLTISELHVIEAIGRSKDQTMSSVASLLKVTIGTLSIAINNLVKKGYVTRERSDEDRRVVKVNLSDLGKKAFSHHEAFHQEMIEYTIDGLDADESDILVRALSKITDYFNQKYPTQ